MNIDKKPIVNSDYVVERFENEYLLYTQATTQAIYLNETAYMVWGLCKQGLTVNQIIQSLEDHYVDQKEQIKEDVILAVELLQKHNVVEFSDEQ